MAVIGTLKAILTAKSAQYEQGMKRAAGATRKHARAMERAAAQARRSRAALIGQAKALASVYLGYRTLRAATVGAFEAQSKQIAAINALNLALANQGNLLPGTSQSLQQYASALQNVSTFGDEVILQAQALAAGFGMNERQVRSTTQAAMDFASATGRDLTSAINLLGKAFVGETGELSRYGIIIDKNIPKSEKFAAVIDQVTSRFGGAARVATQNFSGQMAQLGNDAGDTQEALGKLWGELLGGAAGVNQIRAAFKRLSDFFSVTLVIALSEVRAQFLELSAAAANGAELMGREVVELIGIVQSMLAVTKDLPGFFGAAAIDRDIANLEALKQKLSSMANESTREQAALMQTAGAIREAGTAAALATGETQEFKNATAAAAEATRAAGAAATLAAAEVALAAEQKRAAEEAAVLQIGAAFQKLEQDKALLAAEGLQKRLLEIDIARQQEIAGIENLREGYAEKYDEIVAGINANYAVIGAKARATHASIEEAARVTALRSQVELDATVAHATRKYEEMLRSGKHSIEELRKAFEESEQAKRETATATEEHQLSSSEAVMKGTLEIFGMLGKKFKVAAIAGAIIATYQAIAKALASAPWPANLALAAGAAAVGWANVNKIRGAKEGWATGTPGTAFQDFGAGSLEMLHGSEAVVTPTQGKSLAGMVEAAIRRANQGVQASGAALGGGSSVGGTAVSFNISVSVSGEGQDPNALAGEIVRLIEGHTYPRLTQAIQEAGQGD